MSAGRDRDVAQHIRIRSCRGGHRNPMRGVARKRVKILNPSLLSQGRRVSWRLGRILGVYVELGANPNAKNRWCGRSFSAQGASVPGGRR